MCVGQGYCNTFAPLEIWAGWTRSHTSSGPLAHLGDLQGFSYKGVFLWRWLETPGTRKSNSFPSSSWVAYRQLLQGKQAVQSSLHYSASCFCCRPCWEHCAVARRAAVIHPDTPALDSPSFGWIGAIPCRAGEQCLHHILLWSGCQEALLALTAWSHLGLVLDWGTVLPWKAGLWGRRCRCAHRAGQHTAQCYCWHYFQLSISHAGWDGLPRAPGQCRQPRWALAWWGW